jgi:hypothetical protein
MVSPAATTWVTGVAVAVGEAIITGVVIALGAAVPAAWAAAVTVAPGKANNTAVGANSGVGG